VDYPFPLMPSHGEHLGAPPALCEGPPASRLDLDETTASYRERHELVACARVAIAAPQGTYFDVRPLTTLYSEDRAGHRQPAYEVWDVVGLFVGTDGEIARFTVEEVKSAHAAAVLHPPYAAEAAVLGLLRAAAAARGWDIWVTCPVCGWRERRSLGGGGGSSCPRCSSSLEAKRLGPDVGVPSPSN
jgi:hypothetical protein